MAYKPLPDGKTPNDQFFRDEAFRITAGQFIPPPLRTVRQWAREFYEKLKGSPAKPKRLFYIVLRADDEVQIVSYGPRLGCRIEHRFGKYDELRRRAA